MSSPPTIHLVALAARESWGGQAWGGSPHGRRTKHLLFLHTELQACRVGRGLATRFNPLSSWCPKAAPPPACLSHQTPGVRNGKGERKGGSCPSAPSMLFPETANRAEKQLLSARSPNWGPQSGEQGAGVALFLPSPPGLVRKGKGGVSERKPPAPSPSQAVPHFSPNWSLPRLGKGLGGFAPVLPLFCSQRL